MTYRNSIERLQLIIHFFCLLTFFSSCKDDQAIFEELSPNDTGVFFKNALNNEGSLSVLEFEYMYNGAGVAVADFDNDGLQDIFFTGNMVSNRLYRNLGNWKFEDITKSSNVGSDGWSNGVSIVDINQDGYQDIYVCRGGARGSSSDKRANRLLINNGMKDGKLSFEEVSSSWGLADESYSVQSTFFDYDRDGDLDMYLLTNSLVDFNRNTSRPKDQTGKAPSVDKLFRNNGNHTFTDVSASAGILLEGFGLGVEVCDINEDGWPDIYVSNDFLTDDILYINQKDGTFANKIGNYFQHLTFNGMGSDIADINNDGFMDVVVLDMLPPDNKRWKLTMIGNNYDAFQNSLSYGYQPQYIRNTLQLNNGNGTFSEIGQIAGISATDWSWSPLFIDFDNDGLKDLFVTNGYRQDITNLDFMVYGNQVLTMGTKEANRKQRLEQLNRLSGTKTHNFLFKNEGNFHFDDISIEAGFTSPTYSNGMAYADFDNDGDLDIVVNNIDDFAGLYQNQTKLTDKSNYLKVKLQGEAPNLSGLGSQVTLYYQGGKQKQYFTPYRGYLSSVEQALYFGLGKVNQVDSLIITWPNDRQQLLKDIKSNREIILKFKDSEEKVKNLTPREPTIFSRIDSTTLPLFKHKEDEFVDFKIQPLLPHMLSRNGPGMSVSDVNDDGKEDFFIGGAAGQSGVLMLQQSNQKFGKVIFPDENYEDMGTLFFDADNDGDQDLYIVSGGSSFNEGSELYQDRLYQNDGSGKFTRIDALPEFRVSGSVVISADYDKDGLLDLFVGGRVRPGSYPLPPASFLLKNESTKGQIKFTNDTGEINNKLSKLGMVTAAIWTDFNNDTWPDIIVVGEFMSIHFFKNNQGELEEVSNLVGLDHTNGWWNSIVSGDFDNDGDIDYVIGNLGLNSPYKANGQEPLRIYAKDYDKNGRTDPIMTQFKNGKNYIAHSRDDLIKQINSMRARFRTYEDYSNATFEESFLKSEIEDAYVVKSETFASVYLENIGSEKFKTHELPQSAQIAPIYGMLANDYNNDGNLDLLAVGNFFSGEVFYGRYDASIGCLMYGDGHGNFKPVDVNKSGFFVQGDAKSMVNLYSGDKELTLVGINNDSLKTFAVSKNNKQIYLPKPKDVAAVIYYKDGKKQKIEFTYGSGYLSQTSRRLNIPSTAESVVIIDNKGVQTKIYPIP